MQLEMACHYRAAEKKDIQKAAFIATEYRFDILSVLYPYLDTVIDLIGHNIILACPIDYPYGINNTQIKLHQLSEACKRGISIADLVINNYLAINKNLVKLEAEIDQFVRFCHNKVVEPRAILEYKMLDKKQTITLCKLLKAKGIYTVITETGNIVDYFDDSIIVADAISKNTNQKVIIDTNVISSDEFDRAKDIGVHGIRFRQPDFVPKILRVKV